MNTKPLVSIIIPVYNGANYLSEAIDSALGQTYSNKEVLVIDDGSTDGGATEKIALSYGDKIRYFSKPNGGVASALNKGVEQMKGEYFSWLSHDDVYFPDKLESQIKYLQDVGRDDIILYSDYCSIDENSKFIKENRLIHVEPASFRLYFIMGVLINGCTLLVPAICFRECGDFNKTLRTTQDYDLWFRFSEKYEFVHMPAMLLKSRLHPDQDTRKLRPVVIKECNDLCSNFIKSIQTEEIKKGYSKSVPIYYFDFARSMMRLRYDVAMRHGFYLGLLSFYQLDFKEVKEFMRTSIKLVKALFR